MDTQDPPESFGVLKPQDHALLAWPDEQQAADGEKALDDAGLVNGHVHRWDAGQMVELARRELQQASAVAGFGYEVNLVREYLALAERGCHFRAVLCKTDEDAERVAEVARSSGAVSAQAYGRWMHQDLLSHPGGPTSGERLAAATGDTSAAVQAESASVLDDPVAQLAPGHHPARREAERLREQDRREQRVADTTSFEPRDR